MNPMPKHHLMFEIGSKRQPQDSVSDHHLIPRRSRNIADVLGITVRHSGKKANLHLFVLGVYHGEYRAELFA